MRRLLPAVVSCVVLLILAGCGGGSSSSPAQVSVTISPPSASVAVGQTRQFTATVTGTSNGGATWTLTQGGTACSPACGTLAPTSTASGTPTTYTAPATVPANPAATVTATSVADTTKSASAPVTITSQSGGTVAVSPSAATVEVFGSQQFSATINGQPTNAVTWQVNGVTGGSTTTGTISASGLYSAPHSISNSITPANNAPVTVTVTAVSQASSSSSGSATVTLDWPQDHSQIIPVKLGTTGGNANDFSAKFCCGGTLGSLVSRGGNQYILSNNHVLARTDLATLGENIIQPGLIDANCSSAGTTTVGHLSQFVSLEANQDHPVADAAIAQVVVLVQPTVDPQGTIFELGGTTSSGMPTDGPPHAGSGIAAAVGQTVAKSGRSTGLTCSSVFATTVATSVQYQKGCGTGATFTAIYANQVAVTGGDFSGAGDSGSLIVTQGTADPVALLYAGSSMDTVGNPVSDVLNALADPTTHQVPVFVGTSSAHPVAACSLPGPQAAMAARLALEKAVPTSDAITLATRVRDLHAPELMAHPEVQAVGVGASYDNPNEAAILLFVTKGQPRTGIPAVVDGIRTRIIEGDLFAQSGVLSPEQSATLEQSAAPPQLVYSISDAELARAKAVHAGHVDEWMSKAGVQGVGIGSSVDAPGEAALVIFLIRGVAHPPIPAAIDGVRTRIRESSRFRAGLGDQGPRRAVRQGCSLGSMDAKSARRAASTKP